jgi:hypothetical protein
MDDMADSTMRTKISAALAVVVLLLVMGGRVYQFVAHPEWTEAQALIELWWLYLPALALGFVAAALASRTKGAKKAEVWEVVTGERGFQSFTRVEPPTAPDCDNPDCENGRVYTWGNSVNAGWGDCPDCSGGNHHA